MAGCAFVTSWMRNREYRTVSARVDGAIPSATRITPAAAWYERELHDQYGIEIGGHPDLRPLVFHENWPDGVHPMAETVGQVPIAHREYRFLQVRGVGVCEVPVGPVHAGIIEPGHFRFSVVGDTVLHLELRHFLYPQGHGEAFRRRTHHERPDCGGVACRATTVSLTPSHTARRWKMRSTFPFRHAADHFASWVSNSSA